VALSTNDIVAIQQLYAAYNLAIDDCDGPRTPAASPRMAS
jgi:hypothetical protein